MLHRAVQQFLTDVFWGDLDVLLLDLPPGTGDVTISVAQLLPNAEILVVTTPQAAAAEVAERTGLIASQTKQKVVGVIENMSYIEQPDGTTLEIFGSGLWGAGFYCRRRPPRRWLQRRPGSSWGGAQAGSPCTRPGWP